MKSTDNDKVLYRDDEEYVMVVKRGEKILITTQRGGKIAEIRKVNELVHGLNPFCTTVSNDAPSMMVRDDG